MTLGACVGETGRSLTAKKKKSRKLFRYADAVEKPRILTAVGG